MTDVVTADDPQSSMGRPILERSVVRQLCLSLIRAELDRLAREKRIAASTAQLVRDPALTDHDLEALSVEEDGLGFDSLSRIDLVSSVSWFFGLSETGIDDYLMVRRAIGDWVDLVTEHIRRTGPDTVLTFESSGSTGQPKRIAHRLETLLSEVRVQFAQMPQADPSGTRSGAYASAPSGDSAVPLREDGDLPRILCLVPQHHIFGFLFGALAPSVTGLRSLDFEGRAPLSVAKHARPGDFIVATPFLWERLHSAQVQFPSGIRGIMSAGPSSAETWEAIDAMGIHHIVEIFGSTETAGLGTRSGFDKTFTMLPTLKRDGNGIRRIADNAELSVQDHLVWESSLSFRVDGRQDDVVQVGGTNVSPAKVRGILRSLSAVADADVRLDNGRLRAFLVAKEPNTDIEELEAGIRTALAARLPAAARPDRFDFGPALPRNSMGKPQRWWS